MPVSVKASPEIIGTFEQDLRTQYPDASADEISEAIDFGARLLESLQVGGLAVSPCSEAVDAVYTAAMTKVHLIPSLKVRLAETSGQKALQLACRKLCG